MTSTLNPEAVHRAIVFRSFEGNNATFDHLMPRHPRVPVDASWLKSQAVSRESDGKGEYLALWTKHQREVAYRGDAIFPLGSDGFLIVRGELIEYLMPAFTYLLQAEGHPIPTSEVTHDETDRTVL